MLTRRHVLRFLGALPLVGLLPGLSRAGSARASAYPAEKFDELKLHHITIEAMPVQMSLLDGRTVDVLRPVTRVAYTMHTNTCTWNGKWETCGDGENPAKVLGKIKDEISKLSNLICGE